MWAHYQGVDLWRFPGADAYFYETQRMEVDADGAPNAYNPEDTGIDALANAGYPDGGWRSVLAVDPKNPSKPYVQPSGEFAGDFVSMTSLQDKSAPPISPARYVDARTVPYLVFPGAFAAMPGTGTFGAIGAARALASGKQSSFIVADGGPSHAPLGEASIKLIENLGGVDVNPRTGKGAPGGTFAYVVFPRSAATPPWPLTAEQIEQRAQAQLAAVGGWDRVTACLR